MKLTAIIPDHFDGDRLDKVLASVFPDYSRTTIQSWLDAGRVQLNNQVPSKRTIVVGGENVAIDVPERQPQYWLPEKIPIEIVFEDEQLLGHQQARRHGSAPRSRQCTRHSSECNN